MTNSTTAHTWIARAALQLFVLGLAFGTTKGFALRPRSARPRALPGARCRGIDHLVIGRLLGERLGHRGAPGVPPDRLVVASAHHEALERCQVLLAGDVVAGS